MDKITPEDETNYWLSAPSQRTLSDFVADQLRQAILSDKIQPGQRLVEQELADSLKTSRGPVRDALKMLESEGLILRQSHRGAFVAELKPEESVVRNLYPSRGGGESRNPFCHSQSHRRTD